MAQKRLHRADVVAGLEQVRGEGMTQRMAAHRIHQPRGIGGALHSSHEMVLVQMVPAQLAAAEGFDETSAERTRIADIEFWFCPASDAPALKGRTIHYVSGELVVL
jgi:hypothetical protein